MGLDQLTRQISRECIAVRIRKLNRAVSSIYDHELRAHGLKISQLHLLVVVARHGEATPQQIGEVLVMEKSTISRGLNLLLKQDWLEATYTEAGRLQSVTLTRDSERLLTEVGAAWRRAQRRTEELIGKSNLQVLFRAAEEIN